MFFRENKTTKARLLGYKDVEINGMKFTIKRVNPLVDFTSDRIPQIFTDWQSVREIPKSPDPTKHYEAMADVVQAGVVDPELSRNSDDGITVKDLFRDPVVGIKLYHEILSHSLNRFKGLSRLFFSTAIRLSLLIHFANDIPSGLQKWSSSRESLA